VRVVLDAMGAQLEPGEILVCPGTDPAWTPLLMAAKGLITEVGGLMTRARVRNPGRCGRPSSNGEIEGRPEDPG
jgi:phosphoenolpyruvate synthase/pyruvate phosphate dikinase